METQYPSFGFSTMIFRSSLIPNVSIVSIYAGSFDFSKLDKIFILLLII